MQRNNIENNLAWIDLEMTGLDTVNDVILEVGLIVTNNALEIVAESPSFVIYQTDDVLGRMDEWNKSHHTQSGLLAQVRESVLDCQQAERHALEFLNSYVLPMKSPMCGNSICQDRRFLARLMPNLERFFHYRNLDISTLKELVKRWMPELQVSKKSKHRSLDDIRDSIAELKYYREHFLKRRLSD